MVGCNEGWNEPVKENFFFERNIWIGSNIKCPLGFWLNYVTKESEAATRIRMSQLKKIVSFGEKTLPEAQRTQKLSPYT